MVFRHRQTWIRLAIHGLLSAAGIAFGLAIDMPSLRAQSKGVRRVAAVRPNHHGHRFLPANSADAFVDVALEYIQTGFSLCILPDGRYSFMQTGCLGVYERESGYAKIEGDRLVLLPVVSTQGKIPREFLRIRWGRRSYLVPPGKMREFCAAIVGGREPRTSPLGRFYVAGDRRRAAGAPDLPEEWMSELRKYFLMGRVVEVMKGSRVRIDLGAKEGVSIDDRLTVRADGYFFPRWVVVESVSEHFCVADDVVASSDPSSASTSENGLRVQVTPIKAGDFVITRR